MRAEQVLSAAFIDEHPDEAVGILESAPVPESAKVLASCSADSVAAVLERMEPPAGAACLLECPPEFAARVLILVPAAPASRLLRAMDTPARGRLLDLVEPQVADVLRTALRYPVGTAGALMDPSVFPLPQEIDAREAQRRIRRGSRHVRNYAYVEDRSQSLSGVVNLRDLILAKPSQQLTEVMLPTVERVAAASPAAAIAVHPGWDRFDALPVVDENNRVVGVLRQGVVKRSGVPAAGRIAETSAIGVGLAQLVWTTGAALLDHLFSGARSSASVAEPRSRA